MSPIFVRPVREQLEHDRLIRFLQIKYKRKFEVAINVGDEQVAPVKIGPTTFHPDLVLTDGKKLTGLVEVESGESVNNLEAMAQWVHFSRARVPFHLYVPVAVYDVARRLCDANKVSVTEMWTYRGVADGFDLVRGFADPAAASSAGGAPKAAKAPAAAKPKPAPNKASKPASPAKPAKPAKKAAAKPARQAAPKASKPSNAKKSKPAKAAKKKKTGGKR